MKKPSHISTQSLVVISFFTVFALAHTQQTAFAKTSCTVLTRDLSKGSTNSNSGYQVSSLQKFLYSSGYLKTSPTGRYGDQTVTAVKKFQLAKGIIANGKTGPLTRSAIEKASCSAPIAAAPSNATTNQTPPQPPTNSNIIISSGNTGNGTISTPASGAQLTIGQKYAIQWSGSNTQSSISILLKDANGAGAGYVAKSLSGSTNQYTWTTGNVSVAGQQANVVTPGNYQISIIDDVSFGSAFNIKSGVFSIAAAPLFINHILPSQAPADGKTTVVLYGSGYGSSTRAILTGPAMTYNPIIVPQYVSGDGTLIWFYIPQYVTPGQYQVSVYNNYSSDPLATSTPSNSASIQITQGS